MVISTEAENTFDKIKYPLIINSQKTKNLRRVPQPASGHLQITTANIILHVRMEYFDQK